jgi:hypothetical protein
MKWIGLLLLCSVLVGCGAWGSITQDISKTANPKAHQAYERSVECQKQGKLTCG